MQVSGRRETWSDSDFRVMPVDRVSMTGNPCATLISKQKGSRVLVTVCQLTDR